MRLATVQRNAENQQQQSPQENWDQPSQLHVTPIGLQDERGERHSAECLDQHITALSPRVHIQRDPTTGFSKRPN